MKILNIKLVKSKENKVEIRVDGKNKLDSRNEINSSKVDDKKVEDNKVIKKKNHQKKFKSKKTVSFSDFFIVGVRLAFTKLR